MKILQLLSFVLLTISLHAQDAYHTDLLDYLSQNYEIENPEFVVEDTEVGIINSAGFYGNSTVTVNDVSNFNFTKSVNIRVNSAGNNQWDSGYNVRNKQKVEAGDIVLISFWAKKNSDASELFIFSEDVSDYSKEFYFSFSLTPDWTQYFLAYESQKTYNPQRMTFGFHLAALAQNFDIAGLTALNFKQQYDLAAVPSSFDNGSYEGSDPDAPWRALADERIENLRKSDLTITVINEDGNLIEDAEVEIEMQSHDFGFGSAFVTCRFPGNDCFNSTYVDKVFDLDGQGHGFNVGVSENAVKWDAWEEEWLGSPDETADAFQYLHDNGVTMRGHTLFWPGYNMLPDDIRQNNADLSYVRDRIQERIETMINHPKLKNIIKEWDVLNEITVNRDFENIFKNDPNFTTGREIYQEIFEKIRAEDPELKLYMNDYVVLSGGGSSSSVIDRYNTFLTEMQQSDQPFDGIGFQCHIGSNPNSILKLQSVLDDYSSTYNVPIKITEYDINDLVSDEVAGQYMADFLTMIFSHEAVEAFIMWGFWDGNHWKDNAPMFDINWNLKPSGQAFIDKVFNEWWTSENGSTDATGKYTVRAFKGTHKVTVRKDGKERTADVLVTDDKNVQLLLEGLTSIEDELAASISIAPNPVTGKYIQLLSPSSVDIRSLELLTMEGKLVRSYDQVPPNGKVEVNRENGMYILNINTEKGVVTKKIVIKN